MQVHIQNDGPVTIELESPIVDGKIMSKKDLVANVNGELS